MDCPKCRTRLTPLTTAKGVVIDNCGGCHGTWLDKGEAQFFTPRPAQIQRALCEPLLDEHRTGLACPRCGGELIEGGLLQRDYLLDRCEACGGIWFDDRELDRLRDAKLLGVSRQGSRPAFPAISPPIPPVGAAAFALPNLALRTGAVIVGLAAIVTLAALIASESAALPMQWAVGAAVGVVLLQFVFGPSLLDWVLRRFQSLTWTTPDQLPDHLRAFVERTCASHQLPVPRIGIIEDGAPNAFTYGHLPRNARLVLTRGLVDLLEPKELEAVVAHELGHVAHRDVLVMTAAGLIPLFVYYLYRTIFSDKKGSGPAIAVYLLYLASEYVVLMLSRAREYHADKFAAEATGEPNALALALVKIAYGLVADRKRAHEEAEKLKGEGKKAAKPREPFAAAAMGIFDAKTAQQLAASTYAGGSFSRESLVGAMQWDLWNPWGSWFELHSTHPLPAKRIGALSALAHARGQLPVVSFDTEPLESYWDDFGADLVVKALPWVLGLLGAAAGAGLAVRSPWLGASGAAALGFALGYAYRTARSYWTPGGAFPDASVAGLVRHLKASPVRGIPARLKGRLIGRGEAGLVWNEDSVLRDRTGIMLLDYRQPIRPIEWLFGLYRNKQLIGEDVVAEGWYRRSPGPYLELSRLTGPDGKTSTCYVKAAKFAFAVLLAACGAALLWGSLR